MAILNHYFHYKSYYKVMYFEVYIKKLFISYKNEEFCKCIYKIPSFIIIIEIVK